MYYSYFGLKTAPFSIAPNPEYLLMTERHQEALAHLYHGIGSDAGFVLLTGDVGTGKTTVCRQFLNHLPEQTQIVFILNPCLDSLELLQAICQELAITGVDNHASLRQLSDSIYQDLLAKHAKGINTVLLIDEAQQMHKTVLEHIRLLTNLETDTQKLLKIILVGQPELNQVLAQPDLVQLSQRITARYHIKPLVASELGAYIDYRLQAAGYSAGTKLFPASIVKQLFAMSAGVPRVINVICDRALLGVYSQSGTVVTKAVLRNAYREVKGNYIAPKEKPSTIRRIVFVLGLLVAMTVVAVFWQSATGTRLLGIDDASVPVLEKSLAPVPQMPKVERELMVEPEAVAIKPTVDKPKYFEEKEQAITHLVAAISPTNRVINDGANILGADCDDLTVMGWRCEEVQAISWVSFKKINRPAIIRLTKEDEIYYAVVIGMTKTHAVVLSEQATVSVPLIVMGEYWTGEFTYLWQVPEDFERFIYKKSSPSLIQWLANAFATLDDRQSLLAEKKYNRLLEKRIKLFQRKYALKEDGKAGIETLLTLNERLGRAVTLNTLIVSTPLAIQ